MLSALIGSLISAIIGAGTSIGINSSNRRAQEEIQENQNKSNFLANLINSNIQQERELNNPALESTEQEKTDNFSQVARCGGSYKKMACGGKKYHNVRKSRVNGGVDYYDRLILSSLLKK